ncbi:MAG: DUF1491 family protein [Alphaproteobacteria bacterium]|nr:DUF1491 family protein [Alphaproteobacteria bacterium]
MDARPKTELWIGAAIRTYAGLGVPTTVARKGAAELGSVLIKLNGLDQGCRVYVQTRRDDDRLEWTTADGPPQKEGDADARIAREVARDPDLWVLEIEDRQMRLMLPPL